MMYIQEQMVRKIVRELRGFDNVYFELCNEPYHDNGPKLGAPWNDRIVRAIRSETRSHLIALNVANGSVRVEQMHPGVSIFNFHYCEPPDAVAMNAHHRKVIAYDESGFKGTTADIYRKFAYDFILAGGAVFSGLDWTFTVDSEEGRSTAAPVRLGHKDPALRPQLGALKRFIERFDFIRMRPDNSVIRGGVPAGATARAFVDPGKAYAFYVNGGTAAELQLTLPPGTYTVEWIDTRTGSAAKRQKLQHKGGAATVGSPPYFGDIALRITA
jgi:hypothetical protein